MRKLLEDYKKLREDYLRSLAEFDNYRKRRDREIEEMRRLCAMNVIKDIIPVLDNFERALNAGKEDDPMYKGVKMIYSQLMRVLEEHGLESYSCLGEKFDPNLAEVIGSVYGEEDGVVVEEVEKGYKLNERVIRPAKVVVSRKKEGGENNG